MTTQGVSERFLIGDCNAADFQQCIADFDAGSVGRRSRTNSIDQDMAAFRGFQGHTQRSPWAVDQWLAGCSQGNDEFDRFAVSESCHRDLVAFITRKQSVAQCDEVFERRSVDGFELIADPNSRLCGRRVRFDRIDLQSAWDRLDVDAEMPGSPFSVNQRGE